MAVDDRWFKTDKTTGKRVPSARHKRGMRWRVRNPGYREQYFERKDDAKALDDWQRGQIVAGMLPFDPTKGTVLFERYATDVLTSEYDRDLITERTYKKYMGQLRLHVFPYMGGKRMCDIDAKVIKGWLVFVGKQVSRKTKKPLGVSAVNLLWVVVGHIFKEAQIERVKMEHPMASVERVDKPEPPRVAPWPETTVAAVLSAMDERERGPASMSVMVGARPGESLAFALGDFKGRRVTIRHGIVYGGPRGVRLALPKNSVERSVPCPPMAWDMVKASAARWGTIRVWCECHEQWNDVVFHDGGELWSPRRYTSRVWVPAVTAAGLLDTDAAEPQGPPEGQERPMLRLVTDEDSADDEASADLRPGQHQLRHFYASAEIAEGVSPGEVQKRLGHKSLDTTMGIYHHLFDDQEDAAADRVNARMAGLPIMGDTSAPTGTTGDS